MAGREFERQERKFIQSINAAVKQNKGNPITLVTKDMTIEGVMKAEKFRKRFPVCAGGAGGGEAYTDVILHVKTMKGMLEKRNVSMKGERSPSLAGGGACGINHLIPGLVNKFMKMVHAHFINHLKVGDKVPESFGKISHRDKVKIVVGTQQMGGPIDMMYIGPMIVISTYHAERNQLHLNGNLYDAISFANQHNLYLYLRARHQDQRFDPTAKDKYGVPKVYSGWDEPGRKNAPGRIAVTDRPHKSALIVQL